MSSRLRSLLVAFSWVVCQLESVGQQSGAIAGGEWKELWQYVSSGSLYGDLGVPLAAGADVNGDGIADVLAGDRTYSWTATYSGAVHALSGLDGRLLWRFDGAKAYDDTGFAVGFCDDVNGDGRAEVLVGAPRAPNGGADPGPGLVYLASGADGTPLRVHRGLGHAYETEYFGWAVTGLGDQDDDGLGDYAVGAPFGPNWSGAWIDAGRMVVYSGATGAALAELRGSNRDQGLGESLARWRDFDGDGHEELLVGVPGFSGTRRAEGAAYIYSPSRRQVLAVVSGGREAMYLGQVVANAGDLDGDGIADFMCSYPGADVVGLNDNGYAVAISGLTLGRLWHVTGIKSGDMLGSAIAAGGDLDRDGCEEVLVGVAGRHQGSGGSATVYGSVQVRSGRDGALLWEIFGPTPWGDFGWAVAGQVDLDNNAINEIVIGEPDGASVGRVRAYSFDPYLWPDRLSLSAAAGGAVHYRVDFPSTEAGLYYGLLASAAGRGPTTFQGIQVPLTRDSLFQRLVHGWSPPPLQGGLGRLDANGDAAAVLAPGPGAMSSWVGLTLYAAAISHDGASARLSSAPAPLTIRP